MVRKVIKKLKASMTPKRAEKPEPVRKKTSSPRVLTAEGWRRLMLKKQRRAWKLLL